MADRYAVGFIDDNPRQAVMLDLENNQYVTFGSWVETAHSAAEQLNNGVEFRGAYRTLWMFDGYPVI